MKTITKILLILTLPITIISCTDDDNSTLDHISSPFTVKYEITASSLVVSSYGYPIVSYINSTGQLETVSVSNLSNNNPWNKTIDVSSTKRPFELSLLISTTSEQTYLYLKAKGSITQNLYINDQLIATSTNQSASSGIDRYHIEINSLNYTVE